MESGVSTLCELLQQSFVGSAPLVEGHCVAAVAGITLRARRAFHSFPPCFGSGGEMRTSGAPSVASGHGASINSLPEALACFLAHWARLFSPRWGGLVAARGASSKVNKAGVEERPSVSLLSIVPLTAAFREPTDLWRPKIERNRAK